MKLLTPTPPQLEKIRKEIFDVDASNFDEDVLDNVENWLEAITSLLAEAFAISPAPESLDELIEDHLRGQADYAPLWKVRRSVRKLYGFASAFSYGICTLSRKDLRAAEQCLMDVQAALEEAL